MALKDKKPEPGFIPDKALVAEIRGEIAADGTVSCAAAVGLAEKMKIRPQDVGRTLDALAVHLSRCQIGTFGYPEHAKGWSTVPAEPVLEGLAEAMRAAAGAEKKIGCRALWELAERFRIPRMEAGRIADRAGLKIVSCQLGAF